jgi:phage FluMu gp28-like protein
MSLQEAYQSLNQKLYPWQKEYLQDTSDRKIVLKPRQVGYTTVIILEAIIHAIQNKNHTCYMLSKTVRQAKDDVLSIAKDFYIPFFRAHDSPFFENTEEYASRIDFPNGSTLRADAGDPGKMRGKSSASFFSDEFAHWEKRHLQGIESAIDPIVSNNANSRWVIISTPWDTEDNLFHSIWTNGGGRYSNWSNHSMDIYDAFENEAYKSDREWTIEEKKREKTRQEWRTEYMAEFLKLSDKFFNRSNLNDLYTEYSPDLSLSTEGQEETETHIGIDIGRESDRTSIVVLSRNEELAIIRNIYQMRQERFRIQEGVIKNLLNDIDYDQVCVDGTAHPALAEGLKEDLPHIEIMHGDRQRKVDRTTELKNMVENKNILIESNSNYMLEGSQWAPSSVSLVDDLMNVSQEFTRAGNMTFRAESNDDGHGDSYSALLLALHADSVNPGTYFSF